MSRTGIEKLNARLRGSLARRRLDDGDTFIFSRPRREKMQTIPVRVTMIKNPDAFELPQFVRTVQKYPYVGNIKF